MRRFYSATLLLIAVFASNAFAAIFEGRNIEMSHEYPTKGTLYTGPQTAVVGPGIEGNFYLPYTIDVSDTEIYIDFSQTSSWGGAEFNGIRIRDIDSTIPSLSSVTLVATNMGGFSQDRISFDADNVWLNLQGLPWNPSMFIQVAVTAVPELSTFSIHSAGLLMLAAVVASSRKTRGKKPCLRMNGET